MAGAEDEGVTKGKKWCSKCRKCGYKRPFLRSKRSKAEDLASAAGAKPFEISYLTCAQLSRTTGRPRRPHCWPLSPLSFRFIAILSIRGPEIRGFRFVLFVSSLCALCVKKQAQTQRPQRADTKDTKLRSKADQAFIRSTKRSKRYSESCGPGADSGWYWTEKTGSVL